MNQYPSPHRLHAPFLSVESYIEITLTKRPFGIVLHHEKYRGGVITKVRHEELRNVGLARGHRLLKVNGDDVTRMPYVCVIHLLKTLPTPITFLFAYTTPLARDIKKATETRSQLWEEKELFRKADLQEDIMNNIYWKLRRREYMIDFGGTVDEISPVTDINIQEIKTYALMSREPEDFYFMTVTHIDASNTGFSPTGWWNLLDFVSRSKWLTHLNLDSAGLTDEAIIAILDGIKKSVPLHTLSLHDNVFSSTAILHLTNEIQYHPTLMDLSLDSPDWDHFVQMEVRVWRFVRVLYDICEEKNHVHPNPNEIFVLNFQIHHFEVLENFNKIKEKEKKEIKGMQVTFCV